MNNSCESNSKEVNIVNLELDLGNYNIKSSKGVIFRSTFEVGVPANPLGENVITFDGQSYTMEKGSFDNTFNKARKNYLPNLLYVIIKSSSDNDTDFNLMLGYPLENATVAEEFKNNLINKEFDVKYQKGNSLINRKIRIHDVKCVGEGLSAYYTLDENERGEDLIIFDIGGRTTNIAIFQKRKLINKFTYPEGTLDLFDNIASRWNNAHGENKKVEDIERLVDKGFISGCEVEEKQFLDDLMNFVEKKVDRRTYKNYYTGGGAARLKSHIENYLDPNGIVMENPLFSNCYGTNEIAKVVW